MEQTKERSQDVVAISHGSKTVTSSCDGIPGRKLYKNYTTVEEENKGTPYTRTTTLPKEFDAANGIYTVQKPGYYLIDVRPIIGNNQTLTTSNQISTWRSFNQNMEKILKEGENAEVCPQMREFIYLVLETDLNIEYVDILREGGGLLRHVSKGTKISIQVLDVKHAPIKVSLRIEMVMRKRVCRSESEQEDLESTEGEDGEGVGGSLRSGKAHKKPRKNLKSKGSEVEKGISSSDEEWEEGFSSDTDNEAKINDKKEMRQLTKKMKIQNVSSIEECVNPDGSVIITTNSPKSEQGTSEQSGDRGRGRGRGVRGNRTRRRGRGLSGL